jgi:hypothetical protein
MQHLWRAVGQLTSVICVCYGLARSWRLVASDCATASIPYSVLDTRNGVVMAAQINHFAPQKEFQHVGLEEPQNQLRDRVDNSDDDVRSYFRRPLP